MNWKNYLSESSEELEIPFIVGPTASGKTKFAIDLAKQIDGEIISADSMAIYKEMNIGTAKPSVEEQEGIPHHLIDFIDPDENYSVAQYYSDATKKIKEIIGRGKRPIICGGTGLYINALSLPFNLRSRNTNEKIKHFLEEKANQENGNVYLYNYLKAIDPETAKIVHPNNVKRVIRALEIYLSTGRKKSDFDKIGKQDTLPYKPVLLAPDITREQLYENINKRVDLMIEQGLVEEVRELDKKYSREALGLQAIGYKEFFDYLDGKESLDEAIRKLKRDTRHFAKRQLTWFRKDNRINYFDPKN